MPVSPSSASIQFDMTGKLPSQPNLTFMFVNPMPFDVRLEGTPKDTDFLAVTSSTGWPILARTTAMGPFTSKMPRWLSVMAWDNPGNRLVPGFDYTGCFIELVYGRGN